MKKKKRKLKKVFRFIIVLAFLFSVGYCGYIFYRLYEVHNENNKSSETSVKKKEVKKDNKINKKPYKVDTSNIDIKKIKKDNNLDFDIPKDKEELFKKYAYVVEKNENITEYKKYVYDLFKMLMQDNITEYLDEQYFFSKLSELKIEVNESITNEGVGGYYHDNGTTVEIDKPYSVTLYHELVHFIDYSINNVERVDLWKCKDKIIEDDEYEELSASDKHKCEYIYVYNPDFIVEGGAELYSAKYFKRGVISYFPSVAYLTAMEYILGSEKIDELFLSDNSDHDYALLLFENGISIEDYESTLFDLSHFTYTERDLNYEFSGKTLDTLIDLYKNNMKNKDWTKDETFKYLLRLILEIGETRMYKNSKYKTELSKLAYKTYDDFLKQESKMLNQFPKGIDFNATPVPAYFVDNELYLGTTVIKNGELLEKTFGYFKYDFSKQKMSDIKYVTIK